MIFAQRQHYINDNPSAVIYHIDTFVLLIRESFLPIDMG